MFDDSKINIVYCRIHRTHGEDGCEICDREREDSAIYLSTCCEGDPVSETLQIDDSLIHNIHMLRKGTPPKYPAWGKCSKCFEDVDFTKEYPEYE